MDWTTIDADGDGNNWQLSPLGEGFGHLHTYGVMMSYSYSNYSGALDPDNYLVSPKIAITSNNHYVSFQARALDEVFPEEHFGLAVSTTTATASEFTMIQEWTMTAKQGTWHEYTVDLESYVGQEIYLAIRHFNCPDNFCLCIDDVFIGPQPQDPLTNVTIITAEPVSLVGGNHYLVDVDGFVDGSQHTHTVRATYHSGVTQEMTTTWTYRSSDHFQGSPTGLHATSDGSTVNLSWDLPMMTSPFTVEELFYDFADSTCSDLTLIDANNDGLNFRVYPYGGYGDGNCLRSDSWMTGGIGNANPDNFIVLPRVTATANTVFSFMAADSDMPGVAPDPEHFGVAVSTSGNTNPADFSMVQEWNSTGNYTEYAVDLSAYEGQQIYVAIRHFNTTGDCYYLKVDNIRITDVEAEVTRPAKGALVFADGEVIARLNHGETSFSHMVNRHDMEYCIRVIQEGSKSDGTYYALAPPQCASVEVDCVAPMNLSADYDGQKVYLSWERDIIIDFEDDPQGWSFLDADGDGYAFGIYAAGGMDEGGAVNTTGTNASLASFSYINGLGELHPDNYAFMPKVKILPGARLEFYAAGFDPNYPEETFGVAVASSDGLDITTLQTWTSSHPYSKYEVDLSAYAFQKVFLGFRHCSTNSAYALVIDNINVINAVWEGTASSTERYAIYRSSDGLNYDLIGYSYGHDSSYDDFDIYGANYYYQVTAINSMPGGVTCESAPAMSLDGIHNYVHVTTDAVDEVWDAVSIYPNPTSGQLAVSAPGMTRLTVLNALGQVVYDSHVDVDKVSFDLAHYGVGMYIVRISVTNETVVRKVSVTK